MAVDPTSTEAWIRNRTDELATDEYEFDAMRGMYAVWWIERHCVLWQGNPGHRLILHTHAPTEPDWWGDEGRRVVDLPDPNTLPPSNSSRQIPPSPHRIIRNERGYLERYPLFLIYKPQRSQYADGTAGTEQFRRDTDTFKQSVKWTKARCRHHIRRYNSGKQLDWQFECFMRAYGWAAKQPHTNWRIKVRRFTQWTVFIAKKNKKSPSQAANSLYLSAGDGEPGNGVFPMAASGKQIRENVGKHVHKMIKRSPLLNLNCKLDDSTKKVEHLPTDSYIEPLSNFNSGTQATTEGINGSVTIDEFHVVDQSAVDRVDMSGASRPEPMLSAFSTAGDNLTLPANELVTTVLKTIARGKLLRRLDCIYECPQRTTLQAILDDPDHFIPMANPALGHTVQMDEILTVLQSAVGSAIQRAKVLKYRCNIWQHAAVQFIEPKDWDACARKYGLSDLRACGGGSGLDLSLVDDLCSLVLSIEPNDKLAKQLKFPDLAKPKSTGDMKEDSRAQKPNATHEEIRIYGVTETIRVVKRVALWPVIWIAQEKLEWFQREAKKDLLPWVQAGHLRVIDGRVIDLTQIAREVIDILRIVNTSAMSADPTFAQSMTDQVAKSHRMEIYEFRQSAAKYSHPTLTFERLVRSGQLVHPDNPMQTWQLHKHALQRARAVHQARQIRSAQQ